MSEENKEVQSLMEKAAKAHTALDAMQFAQAAVNVSNALRNLADMAKKP